VIHECDISGSTPHYCIFYFDSPSKIFLYFIHHICHLQADLGALYNRTLIDVNIYYPDEFWCFPRIRRHLFSYKPI